MLFRIFEDSQYKEEKKKKKKKKNWSWNSRNLIQIRISRIEFWNELNSTNTIFLLLSFWLFEYNSSIDRYVNYTRVCLRIFDMFYTWRNNNCTICIDIVPIFLPSSLRDHVRNIGIRNPRNPNYSRYIAWNNR